MMFSMTKVVCMLQLLLGLYAALSAAAQESPARPAYAPFDGKGNHAVNPLWNAAGSPLLRYPVSITGYPSPSGEVMAGAKRPSARAISVAMVNSPYIKARDKSRATNLVSVVGQYTTVDITKAATSNATTAGISQPIAVPSSDPWMTNFTEAGGTSPQGSRSSLHFKRSQFVLDANGTRQQINSVTGFLDASPVYGSSAAAARRLRAGSGGLMRDDGQRGLPFNEDPRPAGEKLVNVSNDAHVVPAARLRAAGFGNTNQNPGVLALATVFLREHNRRAAEAVRLHPSFDDEEAFQYARKWVMAHWQHVSFNEYIPALLGTQLPLYGGYNASTNPTVDNFFSTAAYRYGHATITNVVFRLDEHWQEHPQGHLLLSEVWFQPDKALSAGIEPLLRGYMASPRGEVGMPFSTAVQHNLYGPSNINGTDLLSLNIQRGRDHGLPDYNTCRRLFGLAPATSFANITEDATLAAKLEQLYDGNINNVDAYVGGLAEPHFGKAHVGELFYLSIYDQFLRLRDGDWYYYANADNGLFDAEQMAEIQTTGLRDIILRNTNITELPESIWFLKQEGLLGVCPLNGTGSSDAAALRGGNSNIAGPFVLLNGALTMTITKAPDPSKMRVQLTGKFDKGFIGFGVAQADRPVGQKMVGADMVIARMVDGRPSVEDYHSVGHLPPVLDISNGGSDNVNLISFERSGGSTAVVFERPYSAVDAHGLDNAVVLAGPNTFIVSHGPEDALYYHGIDNRAVLQLNGALFDPDASRASQLMATDPQAIKKRTQHGTLMAVNFIVVFPLGALMARQLRARWLNSLAAKAVLFYMHITVQISGVALATAGFIIATKDFGLPYTDVLFHHGSLGVAILTLIYFQLLIGFVRPPAASALARSLWQLGHALLGRMALTLGVINVFIGIFLFGTLYRGNTALWGGLAAAGLAAVAMLQSIGDLMERRASELLAAHAPLMPPDGKPSYTNPNTPSHRDSLNHHDAILSDDDLNPRDPGFSPGPSGDNQFKPYHSPQHHFGGGKVDGPAAPGGYGGAGFMGGAATGFCPPGGSGLGRGLYYGPVPDDGYERYSQQYNQPPPGFPPSHQGVPAGPLPRLPVPPAAAVTADEETGSGAGEAPAATSERGSRVSFATGVSHHSHPQQQQQLHNGAPGGNSSAVAGPHNAPAAVAAAAAPIRKAFGSFSGMGATLLRRNTTNNSNAELPRLTHVQAADANDAVFCDYETAGVYDPSSGAFKAAGHTKKPPVQELHLTGGTDQGLGFGGPVNPAPLTRRASSSSVGSGGSFGGGAGGSGGGGGGDMLGRTGSNWREAAAAAAAQQRTAANLRSPGVNAAANGRGAGGPAAGNSGMYGVSIASKLAAAKAARDADGYADPAAAAAAAEPAGGPVDGAGGDGGSSAPTVRLTTSMLNRHNRS